MEVHLRMDGGFRLGVYLTDSVLIIYVQVSLCMEILIRVDDRVNNRVVCCSVDNQMKVGVCEDLDGWGMLSGIDSNCFCLVQISRKVL